MRVYTAFFPFCGLGGGARGFLDAAVSVFGTRATFRSVGGIDIDRASCNDFELLTGSPALCIDVREMTPGMLRSFAGEIAPDVVFMSPPCKGASGLLSEAKAKTAKYEQMNRLGLAFLDLMLATWDEPPKLVLFENVPRLKVRARAVLRECRDRLRKAGYVLHDGFHECGELGGLAQRRRRFLLVARHARRVPPLLYHPPKKRIRGCGEVLGDLPIPLGDGAGGDMHAMPKLSWLNWLRLLLIPAGGDWRDLPGVLENGQARRTKFRRHHVEAWSEPSATIGGSGSNGPCAVADPRLAPATAAREWFNGVLGVVDWTAPMSTITSRSTPVNGSFSVADPRVTTAYDHGYAVLHWKEPSATIAGKSHPGNGAYSVADPRPQVPAPAPLPWQSDVAAGDFLRRAPEAPPVLLAGDGTWHRPITALELAALQSLPTRVNGAWLKLSGAASTHWRERIGNAVPAAAAKAVAEEMLVTLVAADVAGFSLSGGGSVWVDAPDALEPGRAELLQ